ncbi:replicase [Coleus vein necrosis virus]|uniref:Replicase n=1 Tax=Coleus vein necrosis virus TaxID=404404 RepID=A7TZR7_9VIRU|nr:replicase [Coleus vein necrosis virus]ABS89245.1 replicase [Coleus vein necrosis virus]
MALTFRSPLEEVLTNFSSTEQSLISKTAINHYSNLESSLFNFFNLNVDAYSKEKLINSGIYLSPFSGVPHSHPVCKTLENHILYRVLPSLIDSTFTFVGIKEAKLQFLRQRHSHLNLVQLINRYVTSADRLRYPSEFHITPSKAIEVCEKWGRFGKSDSLRELLPACITHKPRALFLHDELHYWNLKELKVFLLAVKPEKLLGTLVFPPELLQGVHESLNPWCYTFEVDDKWLHYYPDGVKTEGYTQPRNSGYLLRLSKIHLSDGSTYCVDLVYSCYSHHIIALTLGDAVRKPFNAFSGFDATTFQGLKKLDLRGIGPCLPISFSVVNRIYRYLRTLQKPDLASAMAKLSQILPEPTSFQIKFIREFSELVIKTETCSNLFQNNVLLDIKNFFASQLPKRLAATVDAYKISSLDEFLEKMEPYSFTIKLVEATALMDIIFNFDRDIEGFEHEVDIVAELEAFANPKNPHAHNAKTTPYFCEPYCDAVEFCVQKMAKLVLVKAAGLLYHGMPVMGGHQAHDIFLDVARRIPLVDYCCGFGLEEEIRLVFIEKFIGLVRKHSRSNVLEIPTGLDWFMFPRRRNVFYLTCTPEAIVATKLMRGMWDNVVNELAASSALIKRIGITLSDRNTPVAPLEVVLPPAPEPIKQEGSNGSVGVSNELAEDAIANFTPPAFIRNFSCSCGLEMPISSVVGGDFVYFDLPDVLPGRRAAWFTKDGSTAYTYKGGKHASMGWDERLDLLLEIHGFEGSLFDSALVQEYEQGARIGFHSDDESIFKVGSEILTMQLKGTSRFAIQGSRCYGSSALLGGCHFTMPAGFQETHKHSVAECSSGRTSITFRVLKGTEQPSAPLHPTNEKVEPGGGAVSSRLGAPEELSAFDYQIGPVRVENVGGPRAGSYTLTDVPGDGSCFFHAVGLSFNLTGLALRRALLDAAPEIGGMFPAEAFAELRGGGAVSDVCVCYVAHALKSSIAVISHHEGCMRVFCPDNWENKIDLLHKDGHYNVVNYKNDCALLAVAETLGRTKREVTEVVCKAKHGGLLRSMRTGEGLKVELLGELFKIFSIKALVKCNGQLHRLNPEGKILGHYRLEDGHIQVDKGLIKQLGSAPVKVIEHPVHGSGMVLIAAVATQLSFEINAEIGDKLAECLVSGRTGVISSQLFNGRQKLTIPAGSDGKSRAVNLITGVFGCGKSTLMKRSFESGLGSKCYFVTPRRSLADIFSDELTSGRIKTKTTVVVQTYEKFLRMLESVEPRDVVIFDEMQLFPHGYFDLTFSIMSQEVPTVCLGDLCQSDYDCATDRSELGCYQSDMQRLLQSAKYTYYTRSHRFQNSNFAGRLPCQFQPEYFTNHEDFTILHGFESLNDIAGLDCILVSSFNEKTAVKALTFGRVSVQTFGESTGLTFNSGAIFISEVSKLASEQRWLTALSRFRMNLTFVSDLGCDSSMLAEVFSGRVLGRFLSGKANVCDLRGLLAGSPDLQEDFPTTVGKNQGLVEEKVVGDPWLKAMLFLGQETDEQEVAPEVAEVALEVFKTHAPRCELEGVRARWHEKIQAKEFREKRMGYLVSEQFTDEHSKNNGKKLTNAAERFETIYPKHKNSDTVTFIMGARKRLRFSKPLVEARKLQDAKVYGEFMLQNFPKYVPLRKQHNKGFMDKALRDFESKKVSKSAAIIANHAGRSCRDWLADVGLVFMKSQHCTKFDNRFRDAKAAQSIVCFQHAVLCRFAPYMRYIEMKLQEVLPSNFYVHSGKGLDELSEWVKKGKFEGICTESDYEAFDASQDQYIMAFELKVMEYLGIPKDLIADYVYIKTHLGSKLGNFAIMRYSGEASTFLFNTMANMLFTFLRYDVKGNEFICFAGDDMCANTKLRKVDTHESFLSKLKLKAKVGFVNKPTFCGWNLCSDGIYKKPQLVLERLCIAKETNNLTSCIDNYAIEVSYAYRMSEKATMRMSEEELDSHYNCLRIIIKNKHLMKSEAANIFKASDVGLGI